MKSHPLYIFLAACFALCFSACEQVIVIELPPHTPQLIVNCTFTPDSVFMAQVSVSRHLQDTAQIRFPQDATVLVYEDGVFFDSLKYTPLDYRSAYRSTRKPSEGKSYTLRASAAGLSTVEGSNLVPVAAEIQTIGYNDSVPGIDQYTTYDEVTFSFDDPDGLGDFYVVGVQLRDSFEESPGNWIHFAYNIYSETDDPILEKEFNTEQYTFSDNTFDGIRYTIRLRVNHDDLQFGTPYLVLGKVTEDYFRYQRSMSSYTETQFNPFAEPVIIHSNMTPEMGIFAGYSLRSAIIPR